jgi:ABC-2 type transport system permease protein
METLITSTKPSSIVLGKTVAMGLLGLCQLLLLIITALVSYKLCVSGDFVIMGETIDFSSITPAIIILLVVYFILGYFLYAMLNALTGSTVSKAEDVQSAAMPVSFISLMSFYMGYFSLVSPKSTVTTFSSIFPFSSPFTMPSRMIVTDVPFIEVVLSIAFLIVAIALLAYFSIKIYSAAILYYGQKLKLKELFKMSKNN